jgi:ferric-dicitrate binding protein FerR (iron transport regulator)
MDQTPWEHIQNKLRNPNEPENETLHNWLKEDAENKSVLDDLKVIYSITGNVPESFVPQKEQAWRKIISRINIPKTQSSIVRFMLRVAASILLIALGVGGSYFLQNRNSANSFTEVYSPFGHKTMVVLPDNSKVWLNGDSRLKYNTDFSDSRNVELSGEALFEVTKNPANLFTVKSKDIRIEVYGTTFNIQSYDDDVVSEIALVEGSVGLFHDEQLLRKMIPGEVISYDAQANKFSSQQGNISQITSWKSDELIIENETFESMVKYLERWYGVEITLDQSLRQNLRLSFKVKTESLIELLSIIDHITPVSYEINGKQVKIMKRTNRKS